MTNIIIIWPKYYSNNKNNQMNEPNFKIINGKLIILQKIIVCMVIHHADNLVKISCIKKFIVTLFYKLLN